MTRTIGDSRWRRAMLMGSAALLLLVWAVPVLLAVLTSFKDEKEVLAYPPSIFFEPTLKNFREVLLGPTNILPNLASSVIVAVCTTVLTMLIAVPAAYAFARLKLPGRKPMSFYVLATQLVPPIGLIIPYFLIMNRVGWMDTYQGLVLIYLTFSLPFAIWLMISYFEDIPREMEEAARFPAGDAIEPRFHIEGHADRFKSHPGIKALVEAGPLADAVQGIDGFAIDQAEIAGTIGQFGAAQRLEDAVEQSRRDPHDGRVRGAIAALAISHVVAFVPAGYQIGDGLWRVLQVAVHDDDAVAAGMLQTGRDSNFLAEVAAEGDRLVAGVAAIYLAQHRKRPVGRAVVDNERFPRMPEFIEGMRQPPLEQGQPARLVQHGDDDGETAAVAGWRISRDRRCRVHGGRRRAHVVDEVLRLEGGLGGRFVNIHGPDK